MVLPAPGVGVMARWRIMCQPNPPLPPTAAVGASGPAGGGGCNGRCFPVQLPSDMDDRIPAVTFRENLSRRW